MKRLFLFLSLVCAAACCPDRNSINVVPYPNEVTMKCGSIDVTGAAFHLSVSLDDASKAYIEDFAKQLSLVSGVESAIVTDDSREGFTFALVQDLGKEAYTLKINGKTVDVKAGGLNGFVYAIQTLKQMLPAEIFGTETVSGLSWTLPRCTIKDEPRFGYRGMHMDVSRHFFDMDMVKKYLDIMTIHKLNTLHWHLTDDQGWRIEIKKYPKLTEVGSIRKKTIIGHIFESDEYDHTPYGEGCFFTRIRFVRSSHTRPHEASPSFRRSIFRGICLRLLPHIRNSDVREVLMTYGATGASRTKCSVPAKKKLWYSLKMCFQRLQTFSLPNISTSEVTSVRRYIGRSVLTARPR